MNTPQAIYIVLPAWCTIEKLTSTACDHLYLPQCILISTRQGVENAESGWIHDKHDHC